MKSFKQYLIEADQINYNYVNITSLRKRNIETAQNILKDNKELIQDINNADHVSQFNTEEQRDAVVATYILQKELPEYAQKIGIDLENPKFFEKQVRNEFIDPTRHKAKELGIKNPTIKQVKEIPEKAKDKEEPEAIKEPEAKEVETVKEPEEPEAKEVETVKEPEKPEAKPFVDKEEFPDPMATAKKIKEIKKNALEAFDKEIEGKSLTREKTAILQGVRNNLLKKLDSYTKKAEKQTTGFSVHPTASSMRKASTIAKQALNSAETAAEIAKGKIERKQLDIGPVRMAKRIKELGQKTVKGAKKVKDVRGVKLATDVAKRTIDRISQNTTAKMIQQKLGSDKAIEYIKHIENKEIEKAESLAAQAKEVKETERAKTIAKKGIQKIERRESKLPAAERLIAARKAIASKTAAGTAAAASAVKKVGQKIAGATAGIRTRNIKNVPDFIKKTPEEIEKEKRA